MPADPRICEVCGDSVTARFGSSGHVCKRDIRGIRGPNLRQEKEDFSINDLLKFRDDVGRHLASITIATSETRHAVEEVRNLEAQCLARLDGILRVLSRKPKVRRKRRPSA